MKRKVPVILSALLAAGITVTPAMTAEAAPAFNPYNTVQAEAKFGGEGIEVTTEESGATVVSSIDEGDYFYVKDINFSNGLSKITISAKTDSFAVIDVRKGGVDGESLGNIKLLTTGQPKQQQLLSQLQIQSQLQSLLQSQLQLQIQ